MISARTHTATAGAIALLLAFSTPAQSSPANTGKSLAQAFLAAYAKADHFIGTIKTTTRGQSKQSETLMKVWLKKPNHSAFLILEAPQKPASVGTKLVWHGDEDTVSLRTRFFGLPITMHPRHDDPRLAGVRGDGLLDLAVTTAVAIVKDPTASFEFLGTSQLNGRQLQRVKMRSPKLLPGISHEILGIDEATKLPLLREMHAGDRLVYRMEVQNFQLDGPWPKDAWDLTTAP